MGSNETSEKPKDQQLEELLAAASHDYAHKKYETASELYAQCAEIQDEINGEMNPANADLLYAYGRCLHHLAVSKSDVLGNKVAGPSEGASVNNKAGRKRKREEDTNAGEGSSSAARGTVSVKPVVADGLNPHAEQLVETIVDSKDGMQVAEQEEKTKQEGKPFFQISGDDGEWEEGGGDDEGDDEAADAEAEEEEDDLATAFEILDVARVLLTRQVEELQASLTEKGNTSTGDDISNQILSAQDRLADTHDLQAEISLENERFEDAVSDARASLAIKKQLHDETHGEVSEAHFKLSLALELGSVTTAKDQSGMPIEGAPQKLDQAMRDEAANEMEAAIRSTKARLQRETTAMKDLRGDQLRKKQEEKKDVEEIVVEMQQRLEDLRNPPVSVNSASGLGSGAQGSDALRGILGEVLGESPEAFKARIAEASKGANDLSGMVKHKKTSPSDSQATGGAGGQVGGKGKRKAGADGLEDVAGGDTKRTKSPAV